MGAPGSEPLARLVEAVDMIANLTAIKNSSSVDFIDCQGSGDKLAEEMASGKYPWMHCREEKLDE